LEKSKIDELKILLQNKKHIHITIHIDNLSHVNGKSLNNANAYVTEDDLLVIEDIEKKVTLSEESITEVNQNSAKVMVRDENQRNVTICIYAR